MSDYVKATTHHCDIVGKFREGCVNGFNHFAVAHCPKTRNLVLNKCQDKPFYLMIRYASDLVIVFMNTSVNIMSQRKSLKN